jgi:hypothetical protein
MGRDNEVKVIAGYSPQKLILKHSGELRMIMVAFADQRQLEL